MSLNRHGRLKFDPLSANIDGYCNDNVGVYLRDGYGLQLTSTTVDDCQALDTFIKDFAEDLTNIDGYLFVDVINQPPTSPDAYVHDGYGNQISSKLCPDGRRALDVHIACPVNNDGYVLVDIGDASVMIDEVICVKGTTLDGYMDDGYAPVKVGTRVVDCPLPLEVADGYSADMISDLYRRLYVNTAPNIAGITTVASVDNSASLLVSSGLSGRVRILIQNKGEEIVYLGFSSGVSADDTPTGGFELDCGDVLDIELGDCIDLYAVTPTSLGSTVKIMELA